MTVASRIIIALVLFAAGIACFGEARQARRVSATYAQLATLEYAAVEADADAASEWHLSAVIPGLGSAQAQPVVAASYWRENFDTLTNRTALDALAGTDINSNPALLFIATNAAFRAAQATPDDLALTIERLDRVVQAYGEVMRLDPANSDASFNFEFVSRYRDALASGKIAPGSIVPGAMSPSDVVPSPDLPTGPTIHGLPGHPPVELPGSDFRTIVPVPYDEREEAEPGEGAAPRRRG